MFNFKVTDAMAEKVDVGNARRSKRTNVRVGRVRSARKGVAKIMSGANPDRQLLIKSDL